MEKISTSFSATPRTRSMLKIISAYHQLPSMSDMIARLIGQEYKQVEIALNKVSKVTMESEVDDGN